MIVMSAPTVGDLAYWGFHVASNAPSMFASTAGLAMSSRWRPGPRQHKILVGTHHKVLTVYLGRVFRAFAAASNRGVSQGLGEKVDYSANVLLDDHSQFNLGEVASDYVGLHVRRDPRDLLVSATFYHQRANERWLHAPDPEFEGGTYANYIKSLSTLEDKMLFELNHSSGRNIREMLEWDYGNERFVELRYEELVSHDGSRVFEEAIERWPLSKREQMVLTGMFRYFSLAGPGVRGSRHVRNPKSGQWKEHFTPRVRSRFDELFPAAAARLGYE